MTPFRSRIRGRALAGALLLLASGACTPPAKPPGAAEPPLVRVTAHEFAFGLPDTLPAGLVRIRLVNDGGYWHHALFSRLDSTQTAAGFLAEIRAGKDFPAGAVDVGGTPLCVPGDSSENVLRFEPGRYVALCTSSGGGTWHAAAGMVTGFTVVARAGAATREPQAAFTLVMNDSTFVLPDTLPAGRHWVRVENASRKWEECDILRLEPGRSVHEYRAWRRDEHLGLPRVATPVGGVADCRPGIVQWTLADLRPGRHVLVGEMPGDTAHYRYVEVVDAK